MQALRAVQLRTPDFTYPSGQWPERPVAKRVPVVREVVLEDIPYGGKKYLLDRTSSTVYEPVNPRAANAWPKAVGTYDRVKVGGRPGCCGAVGLWGCMLHASSPCACSVHIACLQRASSQLPSCRPNP